MDDRMKVIKLIGEVLEGETLNNLKEQAGDPADFDELVLEIASPGGSVSEGLEIMVWLDQLSSLGKTVITVVVANAYSIASLIMLSANIRYISGHGKVMVHNPMVPELKYANAESLEKYASDLRELEEIMHSIYQIFTGLDKESIKELMDNETYLSPDEAVEMGFADEVIDVEQRPFEMATNTKTEVNMSKTLNILNKVIAKVNGSDIVNQLYSDVNTGEEIEIFQGDSATYKIGDRTSLEEGEVKLSDGATLTIKDFVITDIDRAVEEGDGDGQGDGDGSGDGDDAGEGEGSDAPAAEFNEGPAPKEVAEETPAGETTDTKSKDDMPSKVIEKVESTTTTKETVAAEITHVTRWESTVINDTFELGDKVEYPADEYNPEPFSVGAGEWELEDGRKILTNSAGIIKYIEEAPAAETTEGDDAPEATKNVEEPIALDKIEAKLEAKIEAKYAKKFEALETEVKELKSFKEGSEKFQAKSAEAIEVIVENTASGFKPDAKAKVEAVSGGSIFQNARRKAGLIK